MPDLDADPRGAGGEMSEPDIRVLGVCGSPRRKATDRAVTEALQYARERHGVETDYFTARGKTIGFCVQCEACTRDRDGCSYADDMQELYELLKRADAVILGTPVYQGGLSGQLKAVMDRCRALVATDPGALRDKPGAGIAVGGDRNGGQEAALRQIHDFYLLNQMIPVGGGAYGANLGAAVWSQDEGAAGVSADEVGLRAIRRTVDRLVEVARLLRAGRDARPPGR
jgi:multimeric flavodoxin WrbA